MPIDASDIDFSDPLSPVDLAKLWARVVDAAASMATDFPYSKHHDPRYCDRCSDDGFFPTKAWRAAWDLAAKAT